MIPVIDNQPKKQDDEVDENVIKSFIDEPEKEELTVSESIHPEIDVKIKCSRCWSRFKRGFHNCCSSETCSCCTDTDPEDCEAIFWCCISIFRCCMNYCIYCGDCCCHCLNGLCECCGSMDCGDCSDFD